MLLKFSRPLGRSSFPFSMRRKRPAKMSGQRSEMPQPHHCGLLHRADRGNWSFMAAILWWLLRS